MRGKSKGFSLCGTPKILGKEVTNTQKKNKENRKTKKTKKTRKRKKKKKSKGFKEGQDRGSH